MNDSKSNTLTDLMAGIIPTIAEACGWKRIQNERCSAPRWENENATEGPRIRLADELPYYFNDLNAMAEAEKTLTEPEMKRYRKALAGICSTWKKAICATARQRAKAFLIAKGKT